MQQRKTWRAKLHEIMFETNTHAGKTFEIFIIIAIFLSIAVVMLDSVKAISQNYEEQLHSMEWGFTLLFTVEYLARLYCTNKPLKYATSFIGVVDLLAILPTYLIVFFHGTEYLLIIRSLRVLRIFRILKILQYVGEANLLMRALRESSRKIIVFLFALLTLVVILGSMMYVLEAKADSGFTSIPESVYWAVVTLTTVGYGDISPQTFLGQFLASIIMVLGYSIIAVPTGIVSVGISRAMKRTLPPRTCPTCSAKSHEDDASYCKHCGSKL
ncbi:MAG: Cyclic nucleotide-gated potassium channel [Chlamydiae bacterium]|nr:Cyclic nucleotide-gated potassium channel [Chlamydiota bacterium]